jgi:hypothetical protein
MQASKLQGSADTILTPAEEAALVEDEEIQAQIENNADKEMYDTFDDYAELVVQLGFLSLFVVCFPLAPLFVVFSNILEVKVDLYKLTDMCQHPIPKGAQDIGSWQYFIMLTMYAAVVTNAALFAFTTDTMHGYTMNTKVVAFVAFIMCIMMLKAATAYFIPDVPADIRRIRKRHASLNDSLVRGAVLWDDDDDLNLDGESFEVKVDWGRHSRSGPKPGVGGGRAAVAAGAALVGGVAHALR